MAIQIYINSSINADSRFEENVNEFFDDIEKQGVDLDPDDFLKDYGKNVHLEVSNTVVKRSKE